MRSERETKLKKKVNAHRGEVITHLKYIKEKVDENNRELKSLNGRVRKNEVAISWMKGIGISVTFIISSLMGYFIKE
tara:strand:- start:1229 stop:1459 length:231 start_codon:yes stop_codon:yes gene_type:complete